MFENKNASGAVRRLLCVMIALVMIVTMSACSKKSEKAEVPEKEAEGTSSIYGDESLGIDAKADEALRDYRMILLGGIDNGSRADIMMVLCINKETEEIKMFTVDRDTYMQIADGRTLSRYGFEFDCNRCNEAYAVNGKYSLMKELNRHLDLNIREFIGADWATTAKFIDALGGIEVDIPSQSMLDAINRLIASFPKVYNADAQCEPIESTGRQVLNGWQAVQYLRVRKYDGGSPLAREERNREVVKELFNKAKGMSTEEIAEVYDEIAGDLDTNMSRNTLTDTFAQIATSEISDAGSWPYETVRKHEPEVDSVYEVPDTLYSNVVKLHETIFDQAEYTPSAAVQELSDILKDKAENYLE